LSTLSMAFPVLATVSILAALVYLFWGSSEQHSEEHSERQPPLRPVVERRPQSQPQHRPAPYPAPQPRLQPYVQSPPLAPPDGGVPRQVPLQSREEANETVQNQENTYYIDLRGRASREGDTMARCFRESQEAYQGGNRARAKQLSDEGKAHRKNMEALNALASERIFKENNTASEPGQVDLHGLFVKEAVTYAERSIQDARDRGATTVRLIVGKGLHSANQAAKVKPAIEDLIQRQQLSAQLDPRNEGVLVVRLDAPQSPGVGADEIVEWLEGSSRNGWSRNINSQRPRRI